jgi:hypothetical protein
MRQSPGVGPSESTIESRNTRSPLRADEDENDMNLFSSDSMYNVGDKRPRPTNLMQTAALFSRKLMLCEEGRSFVDDIAQVCSRFCDRSEMTII